MSCIYKITNDINNKIYIGKTIYDINKRFKEHCHDAYSRIKESRPLYAAMRKYGIEHFNISIIEDDIPNEILNEREKYWIKEFNSYSNGYNATAGGEGTFKYDYEQVVQLYQQYQNIHEVARILNADRTTIEDILHNLNVPILTAAEVSRKQKSKPVLQLSLNDEIIAEYPSLIEAERITGVKFGSISNVCRNKTKTAGGYKWRYKMVDELRRP